MSEGQSSSAASSPMPSATSERRAPQSRKNLSMSSNSPRDMRRSPQSAGGWERALLAARRLRASYSEQLVLVRPKLPSGTVENRVHELVPIRRPKLLGETDAFIDHDPERHFRPRLQFVRPDEQQRMFDRIEQLRAAIHPRGEFRIERLPRPVHTLHELPEVLAIRAVHALFRRELLHQVLPGRIVDLPPIKRLHRELPGK